MLGAAAMSSSAAAFTVKRFRFEGFVVFDGSGLWNGPGV